MISSLLGTTWAWTDAAVTPGLSLPHGPPGLLDEVTIDLVPVLLGGGVPLFEQLKAAPILLDGPSLVVEGARVTHLRYTIRRP